MRTTRLSSTSIGSVGMMIAICLGAFTSHFTAGVVNISLPHLKDVFGIELESAQWITIIYLLMITALLPVMGSLGDRFGHRMIHNVGYVAFTITSILVAFSMDSTVLLTLRVVQAVSAAMFQATNIALISIHIPKDRRGRALGWVSTVVALGAMAGPIVGGFISEWLSWKWLFLVHIPFMFIGTILAFIYIPKHNIQREFNAHDYIGMLLFSTGIALLIFGISSINTWGMLSIKTIGVLIVSAICFFLFWKWEARCSAPFISVKILRSSSILMGLIVSSITFLLANIALVTIPFYLIEILHLSSGLSGYVMLAYPLCLALISIFAGRLSDQYGTKRFIIGGLILITSGFIAGWVLLAYSTTTGPVIMLALIGLGMGLVASPNNSYIMSSTPERLVGSVGGLIALSRNLGMVIGAAIGLGMLNQAAHINFDTYRPIFILSFCVGLSTLVLSSIAFGKNGLRNYGL